MVLIAEPSVPTSVRSPESGIRAVRSPLEVISSAVLAISPSGCRPRPMSHSPPMASTAISAPPVISSAMTKSRTWFCTTLTGWATTRTPTRPAVPRMTRA